MFVRSELKQHHTYITNKCNQWYAEVITPDTCPPIDGDTSIINQIWSESGVSYFNHVGQNPSCDRTDQV